MHSPLHDMERRGTRLPLKNLSHEPIARTVRRGIFSFLLIVVLVGCQGSDTGFYDGRAKDEALRVAKKDPFRGHSDVVSVGSVRERERCPQAPSPQAGPCLDVTVTAELPARDLSGKETGQTVKAVFDLFVWLKKRDDGSWKVTHTAYRPKGAAVDGPGTAFNP
jgi:hypothetical protein